MSENPFGNKPAEDKSSSDYVPGSYSQNQQNSDNTQSGSVPAGEQNNQYSTNQYNSAPTYGSQQSSQPPAYSNSGYSSANNGAPAYGASGYQLTQKAPGSGLGLAAMILGILGIVTSFFGLGAILGLVGLILGIIAIIKLKKVPGSSKGMAITGIITGAIALIIGIIAGIFMLLVGSIFMDGYNECQHLQNNQAAFEKCLDDYTTSEIE